MSMVPQVPPGDDTTPIDKISKATNKQHDEFL